MKRFIIIAAAFAALAAAFTSCSKEDHGTQLTAQANAVHAAKYTFGANALGIRSVELTGGRKAIITLDKGLSKASLGDGIEVFVTTYSVTAEGAYAVEGLGTMTVSNGDGGTTASLTPEDSENTITVTVEVADAVEPEDAVTKLCRSWYVTRTVIGIKGGELGENIGVGRLFEGGNLDEIAEYLGRNGVKIDTEVKGYDITCVTFTQAGTFLVEFSGAESFLGQWKREGEMLVYDLEKGGSDLLNAHAEATLSFGTATCLFAVKGAFSSNGQDYTTNVEITLHKQ